MSRRAVTDVLERLAFAAELLDDSRARSWGRAAWAVRNLDGDLDELHESGELKKVRGIGASTLAVIDDVLRGAKPDALTRAEALLPQGLFAVRRIKGLGPKKVKQLWKELSISSLGELEYACRENRLVDLPGFGAKTQDKVLAQIAKVEATLGKMRRDHAMRVLEPVASALGAHFPRAAIVGDYARGFELVSQLGVLAEADEAQRAQAREVVDRAKPPEREVALHLAESARFASVSVWWTSSHGHASALAARADELGLRFDEHGLTDEAGEPVPAADEDAVYRALGLVPTAPERREDDVPLVREGHASPRLVSREDIRGALHNHTVASDGSNTLEQMRDAAAARGLSYLGVSEHSHTAFYAKGLDRDRLLSQITEIDALNVTGEGCALLSGVESDILEHGELDYEGEVLAELDVVVASVHKRFRHTPAERTARFVAAARNRYTDIIGHPTGRLLLARDASPFDMEAFLDACRESGCAVELNANPARLDLDAEHLRMAKERGVLVSISADAHSVRELDHLQHGVAVARRAGLSAEDVLNTRTLPELRAWVAERRADS